MYPISSPRNRYSSFFRVCDTLVNNSRNMDCILFALPALYRLLYSTGIRIGEAISIRNEDINFEHHHIIIRKTKNQQQRLVSLNPSTPRLRKDHGRKMPN
ncbi:tyrosine-type recombinase/integrase [Arachidicoccus sp.]|uniref:tyrosine-type recombinase/integrase n=1 Tax=Arachidicoccus sp. TaxID=1872624 RepID=UPI003D25D621